MTAEPYPLSFPPIPLASGNFLHTDDGVVDIQKIHVVLTGADGNETWLELRRTGGGWWPPF